MTNNDPDPQQTTKLQLQAWKDCEPHRQQITQLLSSCAGPGDRDLCIWGAGPCNDIDLTKLTNNFRRLTLVDLDTATLKSALELRRPAGAQNISAVGGLDLSGIFELCLKYKQQPAPDLLEQIFQAAETHTIKKLYEFDVVVSTCLLTQIIHHAFTCLNLDTEQLPRMLRTLRTRHLELLLQHCRPGGIAILITDVTTSDALPKLRQPNVDLRQVMNNEVRGGNYLHGASPHLILQQLNSDKFKSVLQGIHASRPWIWNATSRLYLCVGFMLQKK